MASNGSNVQQPARPRPNLDQTWKVLVVGAVVLVVLFALATRFGKPADVAGSAAGIGAAAGVLALASLMAVAVERLLEIGWTVVDQVAKNPAYPFQSLACILQGVASQLGQETKAALAQAAGETRKLKDAEAPVPQELADLNAELAKLQSAVQGILAGDPSAGASLSKLRDGLNSLAPGLQNTETKAAVGAAVAGITDVNQFVTSLANDPNPGRRLMSLFIGAYLGLAAAWVLGLDVIHAALGVNDKSAIHLGLAATGVVIGLGSVPLHELIGGLEAFKNAQGSQQGSQ